MDRAPVDILHPLTSLEWSECRRPPETVDYATQAVHLKDKVYVQQRYHHMPTTQRVAARLLIYTPTTDTWNTLDTPVYDFALTTYRSKLVLVGGREYVGEKVEERPSNKVWTLSEDGKWEETLPPMETACDYASAVSHGDHLLVIDSDSREVHVYNGHHWAKAQHLPEILVSVKSTVFNGDLYVSGTLQNKLYSASLDSLIASSQPSETSQPSTVWKTLPDVPGPCHTTVFGDRLVAVGLRTIYAYSPSNQSWVNVGSASVLFSFPCAVPLSSNELMVIGDIAMFKVTLKVTPFDPNSNFIISALTLLEAAGVPVMSSLNNYTGRVQMILGILYLLPMGLSSEQLFHYWLTRGGKLPPTWRSLLQIIRQLSLDDLAYQVETYLRTGRTKYDTKGAEGREVTGGRDVEGQLRSRDEYIFQLKQEMATLSETNQDLRTENEQLRSQRSSALIKEEGGVTVEDRLRIKDGAIYSLKQEVASLREERDATIFELQSEVEFLRSQLSQAPIKEEVEEKPLALVPVKTEVKEEAVTVTKDETTSAQPTAAWDLRGVEVCGEMTVVVHSSGAQQITWEGFGLKLHIDEGSLPAGIHRCTLTIKASLAGQYEFPNKSYLVSAIFWLRCEPMCKFTKSVTVEMQHCARSANVANLKLKFVRAVCSRKQLPYTFKELGGDFTRHSSYGVVEVNGFSGLAITQEESEEREYCSQLFYLGQPNSCHIDFVVTWNVEAHLTAVKEEYTREGAIRGLRQPVDFESDTITLDIPMKGISISGWTITPLMRPVVTKKQVDNFKEGKLTPCCQLLAEVSTRKKKVPVLKRQVNLKGAKYPNNVFVISLPAGVPYSQLKSQTFGDLPAAGPNTQVRSKTFGDLVKTDLDLIPPPNKRSRLESDESAKPIPHLTATTSEHVSVDGPQSSLQHTSDPDVPVPTISSHHLPSLLQQLYEHSASWRDIGGALGFTQGELDTIQASPSLHASAPKSWLTKVLSDWLQWAPGDGRRSTYFATLEKLKDALKQANLGATAHTLRL